MTAALPRACAYLLAAALVAGCATTGSRVDPLEPANRALYQVHEVIDGNLVKPIAQAYVDYTPKFARMMVSNFMGNIDDLFSGVNGLLQGKPQKAGDDFGRVLVNSFFGLGGLFDPASEIGIERGNEDFGQTFRYWGIPTGPYLFVPLFGPLTVTDGIGFVLRVAWSPVDEFAAVAVRNVLWGVGYIDLRAGALEAGEIVDTAALDRYLFIRNAYLQRRRYVTFDGKPPAQDEDD